MSKQLTSENSTMKERLQVSRWGKIRRRMYEMEVGETVEFPTNTGDNVGSTVCRMNDAFYGERKWTCQRRKRVATVTREK